MEKGRLTSEYIPLLGRGSQNSRLVCASISDPPQDCVYPEAEESYEHKRWPLFIWFLLKFLGLFNSRHIVTKRRCPSCHLKALKKQLLESGAVGDGYLYPGELEGKEEVSLESCVVDSTYPLTDDDACVVCKSEWFDAQGRFRPYSESDIGVSRWNHRGSTILSIIWPLTLIAFVMYDFFFYLKNYWGEEKQIIRLISYSSFLLFNLSPLVLIVVANIRNMMSCRERGFCWYTALSIRYIVKRLQHLELGERGLPHKVFLAACMIWPCWNGGYRIFIFYGIVKSTSDLLHSQISMDVGLVCMLMFGAFCYLMLLMRLSFQKQLRLELAFLRRHVGELDICRGRLTLYAGELGSMFRLVYIWIIFIAGVSTWAFTVQISWDYLMMSNTTRYSTTDNVIQYNIDFLIWSENVMFLSLPLLAVGGIHLNGLWVQFRRGISQMRSAAQEDFWNNIMTFCHEQSPRSKVKMPAMIIAALGLILGLKYADQNVEYWGNKKMFTPILPEQM